MASDEDDEKTGETTVVGRAAFLSEGPLRRDRACLVVIAGQNVGEMFSIGGGLVIGRGGDVDVRVVDDEISRRHARIAVQGKDVFVEDLGSKNGTFLNGLQVRREVLRDGDRIQIGPNTVLRYALHDSIEESFQRQMYESALRDPLTRVYNRKYLLDRLQSEMAYALRHGSPLSFLMVDIDHFKKVNDVHGHAAGDAALRELTRRANAFIPSVRDLNSGMFARIGGEEFVMLMPGIDRRRAAAIAELFRAEVERLPFSSPKVTFPVTTSIGVTTLLPNDRSFDALMARADQALYRAKAAGRNQVVSL